ncbi:MAG: spondin domain-containing protein [Planctomycetota bacterium]
MTRVSKRGICCCGLILACVSQPTFGQATYRLTVESNWSSETHPDAYPFGAHFSPLIGATHHDQVSYWEPGGIATLAIESMAESGQTNLLRSQFQADIEDYKTGSIVASGGLLAPGSQTRDFTVSAAHPLLTLVTMVAPSPDWFVGVHGLDLRDDGGWTESIVIELDTYDAGTDAGVDFTSPNQDITPHLPISRLGHPVMGTPSLATLTLTLIDSVPLCDLTGDGRCDTTDLDELVSGGTLASGVAVSADTAAFDLNGDAVVDLADRDLWLEFAAAENGFAEPYSAADANLDGQVDGQDYIIWNDHKFSTSLLASDGDFNGDGRVDGGDFVLWNIDKFTEIPVDTVPEPSQPLVMLGALVLAGWRRSRLACLAKVR